MSLKHYTLLCCMAIHAERRIIIHPHASNRIVHHTYEWDLARQAALEFKNLYEESFSEYHYSVTPLSYAKLTPYDTMTYINTQNPFYCIILSLHEHTQGMTTVRLYYPYYEQEEHGFSSSSLLSFVPYQYGYRKNSIIAQKLTLYLQEKLLATKTLFKVLPYKRAPLKTAIGIEAPTFLIEIGLNSLTTLTSILTILTHVLHESLMEDF